MKRMLCRVLCLLLLLPCCFRASADDVAFTFTASENYPVPDAAHPIPQGHILFVDGMLRAAHSLVSVTVELLNSDNAVCESAEQTFDANAGVTQFRLSDAAYAENGLSFSRRLHFENLSAGSFTLQLTATDAEGNRATVLNAPFEVTADEWVNLLPNNLRGNYAAALRFFGSREKFLFRYKFIPDSRMITVDSAWRKKYTTSVKGVNNKTWSCHVDARTFFDRAARLLEHTYIRVKGSGFDTGAVKVSDLVTFNGSLVTRYVSSRDYISHHSFGTAIDINASSPSFRNRLENREIIYREVHDNLTYDGLAKVDGKQCYAFTYTGSAASGPKNVPEPLLNYFIYEFGFYRAGFSWGFYYPHTCDGMHFTLSEMTNAAYTDGPYALRKVRVYWEDVGTARPGWHEIDGFWYYFDADRQPVTGWQEINGKWYWFAPDGCMITGWKRIGNPWYYFRPSGDMAIGWQEIDGYWYHFQSSGAMTTGWQIIGGKWYYFQSSGAMTIGWQKINDKWYYFQSSGAMVTGTQTIGGKTYVFDRNGVWIP